MALTPEIRRLWLQMVKKKPGIKGQEIADALGLTQEELASGLAAFILSGEIRLV